MHIFRESETNQKEEGISIELLFLRISQIGGRWKQNILQALEILSDMEKACPLFVDDCG